MADRNVRDDNWVDQLVPDPANPPRLQVLTGYRGRSAQENHTRLYMDLELSGWVDIPNDAILLTREESSEQGWTLTFVWTGLDARIQTGPQAAQGAGAEWLQGQVAQDFGEAALPGLPPGPLRTPVIPCNTPLAGCPTPPRLCLPTPGIACPSVIIRCPTPQVRCTPFCPTRPQLTPCCPSPQLRCTPFCPTNLRTPCCPISQQIGCPSLGIACTVVQCPTRDLNCPTIGIACTAVQCPVGQGFEGGWEGGAGAAGFDQGFGMQDFGGGFEAQANLAAPVTQICPQPTPPVTQFIQCWPITRQPWCPVITRPQICQFTPRCPILTARCPSPWCPRTPGCPWGGDPWGGGGDPFGGGGFGGGF
jgi:hypothetical protein